MSPRMTLVTLLLLRMAQSSSAALIVDGAQPITHQVQVQIIQTARDDGSEPATVFGNASQRADMEANIDLIWAQAGVDIEFSTAFVRYDSTFAFRGNQTSGVRPASDLNAILAAASLDGILHPDSSVINLFFVEIVPSFAFTNQLTANGRAQIGSNGVAQFVGSNLLNSASNRDVAAKVVAHEIGHNLGLQHTANGISNLMSPNGTTQQLTAQQIQAIKQTTFRNDSVAFIPSGGTGMVEPLSILPGDYNEDGQIDLGDYNVWRDAFGSTTDLVADGNSNGRVDEIDYLYWKANWGLASGQGSRLAAAFTAVPEPTTSLLLWTLTICLLSVARRSAA